MLRIADHGTAQALSYDDALAFHRGDAFWGCAVAFRALQRAAELLSKDRLWDRASLHIRSAHPGPGVRDTIEYVTRCISGQRFDLYGSGSAGKCTSDLQYEWLISDGNSTARVRLREDFVPAEFYALLDRLESAGDSADTRKRLEEIKRALTDRIWQESLQQAFPDACLLPADATPA